jgi:hypothetical protein
VIAGGSALARNRFAVALAGALLTLAGCGRRATAADCRLIVDKSVELRMKQMSNTDPAAIHKRAQQVSSELHDELGACEGRRVTSRTIACVQASKTSQELEQCLR